MKAKLAALRSELIHEFDLSQPELLTAGPKESLDERLVTICQAHLNDMAKQLDQPKKNSRSVSMSDFPRKLRLTSKYPHLYERMKKVVMKNKLKLLETSDDDTASWNDETERKFKGKAYAGTRRVKRKLIKNASASILDELVIASMEKSEHSRSKSTARRVKLEKFIDNKHLHQEINRLPKANKSLFELQVAEQVISEFHEKLNRTKNKRSTFLRSKHDTFVSSSVKRRPVRQTINKYTGGPRRSNRLGEVPAHILKAAALKIQKVFRGFIARKKLAKKDKLYRLIYNRVKKTVIPKTPEKRLSRMRSLLHVDEKTYMKHQILFDIVKSNDIRRMQHMSHNFSTQDVNLKDNQGNPPLYYSARQGNLQISRFLVSLGARLSDKCENGNSVLHAAFIGDNTDLVYFFLTKGADLENVNKNGKNPMAFASNKMRTALGAEPGRKLDAASLLVRLRAKNKPSVSPVRSIEFRKKKLQGRRMTVMSEAELEELKSDRKFHTQLLHLD
jgi:hypothetical protein